MPAIDDDDRPKKKIVHEIGQELALLSVGELDERIALLNEEIARLEAAIASKQARATSPTSSSRSSATQAGAFAVRGDRHLAELLQILTLLSFLVHY